MRTDDTRQTEDCGLWQLRDQDPLEDWVKGRAIIVGDAAHSSAYLKDGVVLEIEPNGVVLPHQGQGASQAIEDGEAIGACLRGVDKADVPQALQRIFGIRYKRATYTQQISRSSGLGDMRKKYLAKLGSKDLEDGPLNPQQYRQFSWNYFGALEWERNHQDWLWQDVVD
jgi:salicylate hydroxylase